MRITVSHNKPKEEIKRAVDLSFDDLFKGPPGFLPVQMVNRQRTWRGDTLDFSFDAKVGIISNTIKGFVAVSDRDVTIDADFGFLERLFPTKQARDVIETRVKGLLK